MSVLDPNGTPTDNGFDDAFDGGILLGAEGRVTIKPFGSAATLRCVVGPPAKRLPYWRV